MQRVHVDDLAGHLIEAGGWEMSPCRRSPNRTRAFRSGLAGVYARKTGEPLHGGRESLATLEGLKAEIGSMAFAAQYQQAPVPPGGNLIKRDWLRFYDETPELRSSDVILLSWDTAMKAAETADYSVGTAWLMRGEAHYLLDLVRARLEFPELKRRAIALHERWRPLATLVEDKGSGTALLQELGAMDLPAIPFISTANKEMRMHAQSVRFESGSVYLPRAAPWLDDLLSELLAFPGARHDDQVDSISQALEWAEQYRRRPVPRIRRL